MLISFLVVAKQITMRLVFEAQLKRYLADLAPIKITHQLTLPFVTVCTPKNMMLVMDFAIKFCTVSIH